MIRAAGGQGGRERFSEATTMKGRYYWWKESLRRPEGGKMQRGDGGQTSMSSEEQVLRDWGSRWALGQVRVERRVEAGSGEAPSSILGVSIEAPWGAQQLCRPDQYCPKKIMVTVQKTVNNRKREGCRETNEEVAVTWTEKVTMELEGKEKDVTDGCRWQDILGQQVRQSCRRL